MKKILLALIIALNALYVFANEEVIKITGGPYIMCADSDPVIVWTTNKPALSWVEISADTDEHFYAKKRPQYFNSPLGKKRIGTLHQITIPNLERGKKYQYRIFSKEVLKQKGIVTFYGQVASSAVYRVKPLSFVLPKKDTKSITFSVVNDIHADSKRLEKLLKFIDEKSEFLVLNGDMVSAMHNENQILDGFLSTSAKAAAEKEIPIFFARGNHETRGEFSEEFLNYFPTTTGKPYYAFTAGSVFFIFLDGGEDKPDNDIEYFDTADFDKYRADQAKWLKNILESPECKAAKARVVITHIPPSWGSWHGSVHFREQFMDVLNNGKIDVIISAHLHQHKFYPANTTGFNMPNIVNSNMELMNITIDENNIKIKFISTEGKEAFPELNLPIKK